MSSTVSSAAGPEQDPAGQERGRAGDGLRLSPWTIGLLVSVAVLLIGSVLPFWPGGRNLWTLAGLFLLGVGVVLPLIAAGLQVAQAAGSEADGRGPRVGSLSTDQFTHVAAWLAFAHFFLLSVTTLEPVALVGLVGAIGMLVCSPLRFLVDGAARGQVTPRHDGQAAPGHAVAAPAPETPEDVQASWRSAQDGWQSAGASGWYTATGRQEGAAPQSPSPDPALETEPAGETVLREDLQTPPAPADPVSPQQDARPAPDEPHLVQMDDPAAQAQPVDPDEDLGMTRLTDRTPEDARAASEATFGTQAGGSAGVGTQDWAAPGGQDAGAHRAEPAEEADTPRGAEPAQYEAFWFAVGSPRHTVGPDGSPAFPLQPGGWILALEDRGVEFLVQNTDGRTAVLRDLQDIERA